MKTRKYNLSAIAAGVALAMGSMAAGAGQPVPEHPSAALAAVAAAEGASLYPTFEDSEQAGLALVESALSLIAGRTHVDPTFCAPANYGLSVSAFGSSGTATIDGGVDNGGMTIFDTLTPSKALIGQVLGTQVDVSAVVGVNKLKNSVITNYSGSHQWSNNNWIFNDSAKWTIKHPQNGRLIDYAEHSIKDYYKQVVDLGNSEGSDLQSWEFDWGLEKIIKRGYPVAKWTELSWYRQPDSVDGYLRVRKDLVIPNRSGVQCRIQYTADSFNQGAFSFSGTVKVYKPKGQPL